MSFFGLGRDKTQMPDPKSAFKGRDQTIALENSHAVLGTSTLGPRESHLQCATFGMGCFWGAERKFWELPEVHSTAVGYTAGYTPNPNYREVCSGDTGHSEVVLVVFDPNQIGYEQLLSVFWESHNPTQGMRQGNDVGTQYRSGIYTHSDEQHQAALASRDGYQQQLAQSGVGSITTEIESAGEFYWAEEYHQQYLHKNPGGYCGLGGTGVCYAPVVAQ